MPRKNVYETILELYKNDVDKGREFLFENIKVLMRKNPLMKHTNYTYTPDDILSEAYLLWDKLLTKTNVPDNKKISRLWYLFNKWWWTLYNLINQYSCESYTIDDIWDSEWWSYYMDDDMLEYILVKNNVISPLEAQILRWMQEGRWKYEIARLMKTTYYNTREIIEAMSKKIETFYKENSIDTND